MKWKTSHLLHTLKLHKNSSKITPTQDITKEDKEEIGTCQVTVMIGVVTTSIANL